MFIELQSGDKIIKLEEISKISLLKSNIEFLYGREKDNKYILQRYSSDKRAREVYEELKKFINWKPFLTLHSDEREVDFKEMINEIKNKTNINFGLTFNNIEAKINNNAIFTMPKE